MTGVSGKRRGRGEDSIYWDEAKSCYVGAVSLGYSPSGTRVRKRVMARTKTEVREKLKELHQQAENGVRPRRHYTVNDALDDWLETGLDGLTPSTVTVYRNTIAKALREELGTGWVPREMRHTFVSLLSARGVPVEAIALLAGHNQTATTELVYRHQIVPALTRGAEVMDQIFGS